jgi:hypothetical protein
LNFCFIGIGEVLTSCLHTLLRDQNPCSSLPKNVFCFLLVDFNFENGILKNKRERPQGHKIWKK